MPWPKTVDKNVVSVLGVTPALANIAVVVASMFCLCD